MVLNIALSSCWWLPQCVLRYINVCYVLFYSSSILVKLVETDLDFFSFNHQFHFIFDDGWLKRLFSQGRIGPPSDRPFFTYFVRHPNLNNSNIFQRTQYNIEYIEYKKNRNIFKVAMR